MRFLLVTLCADLEDADAVDPAEGFEVVGGEEDA
jgi:hypothetical protein